MWIISLISFFFFWKELISFPSDNLSLIMNSFITWNRQLQLLRSVLAHGPFGSPLLRSRWQWGVMSDSLTALQSNASDTWRWCWRWSTKPRVRHGVGIQLARGEKTMRADQRGLCEGKWTCQRAVGAWCFFFVKLKPFAQQREELFHA